MPIWRRILRISDWDSAVMSTSFQMTLPEVGSIRRLMQRSRVDLPDPLRPMTARNSPSSTSKLTSVRATVPLG